MNSESNQTKGQQIPKTIQSLQEANEWQQRHDPQAPKAGDPAPDFELRDTRGVDSVRLSDYWGAKPVALVFGSFT